MSALVRPTDLNIAARNSVLYELRVALDTCKIRYGLLSEALLKAVNTQDVDAISSVLCVTPSVGSPFDATGLLQELLNHTARCDLRQSFEQLMRLGADPDAGQEFAVHFGSTDVISYFLDRDGPGFLRQLIKGNNPFKQYPLEAWVASSSIGCLLASLDCDPSLYDAKGLIAQGSKDDTLLAYAQTRGHASSEHALRTWKCRRSAIDVIAEIQPASGLNR